MPDVELAPLAPPNFGVALTCPAIHADEYEERLAAFRAASDRDFIVDYGDPEHFNELPPACRPELSCTWTSGSTARSCRAVRAIASGMALQCDIIP